MLRVEMVRDNKLTGAAGGHHVCAELARRDWAPSLTRDGFARTDILAVHTETRVMIEVQVKTSRKALSWPLAGSGAGVGRLGDTSGRVRRLIDALTAVRR